MSWNKIVLSGLVLAMLASAQNVSAQTPLAERKHGYACKGTIAQRYKPLAQFVKQHTTDIVQGRYVFKIIQSWDAQYITNGCKALSNGQSWDDSCLHGRRNHQEILDNLPDNLSAMSRSEIFEILTPIQSQTKIRDAINFCKSLGIYTQSGLK